MRVACLSHSGQHLRHKCSHPLRAATAASQGPHKQCQVFPPLVLHQGEPPLQKSCCNMHKANHAAVTANVAGPDLEAAREVAVDQTSLDTRLGRPCSSTSKRRLALSSPSTVAPANLQAPTAPWRAGCCKLQARQQLCRGHIGPCHAQRQLYAGRLQASPAQRNRILRPLVSTACCHVQGCGLTLLLPFAHV